MFRANISLVVGVLFAIPTVSTAQEVEPDIFYVPTPVEVVDTMFRVAEVDETDVVYDLGSGDGRIVIAAARDFGARAVGVEIDPKYIEQSRLNAQGSGVEDRITFIQGDLFFTDLSEATVVTLYLSQEINLRLLPKFQRELKPGTRIVSHEFIIGNREPIQEMNVGGHKLYYYVMP